MFNLRFKIEVSDILLVLGVLLMAIGIYLIYTPAAVIFLGTACIILAFLMSPRKPPEKRGGE